MTTHDSPIGYVVKSKCGRDKERLYVVCAICDTRDGFVYVADGDLRKVNRPKVKRMKHLVFLEHLVFLANSSNQEFTDKKIREVIERYSNEKLRGDYSAEG
jgi:ribosomal protein L14E/L6E/L27E